MSSLRTTLEIPDLLYRRLKAEAARQGRTVRALVNEAVVEKLRKSGNADSGAPPWRNTFGALKHLGAETRRRCGIRGSRHRAAYESWLEQSLDGFAVVPVDTTTAACYAELRHELKLLGRPIPENDIWIAALARQYGQPVLSRDRHFSFVPELVHLSW